MNVSRSALIFTLLTAPAGTALAFNPAVNQTVGTGSSTSYFVINFNDGPNFANSPASNYIFGYRYDGAPTGEDFIIALQNNVPTFTANQTYYASFNAYIVNAFSYNGHSQTGNYSLNKSSWAFWVTTDARLSQNASDWTSPNYGASGDTLVNNSYDGWTFAANGVTPVPVTAPEPSPVAALGIGLLGIGGMTLKARRRKAS